MSAGRQPSSRGGTGKDETKPRFLSLRKGGVGVLRGTTPRRALRKNQNGQTKRKSERGDHRCGGLVQGTEERLKVLEGSD